MTTRGRGSAARSRNRRTPRSARLLWKCLTCCGLLFVVAAGPVAAQYGRWWWDAGVTVAGDVRDTSVGGGADNRYEHQRLALDLGLNGYLGHPAIGRFRLNLEGTFADNRGASTRALGWGVDIDAGAESAYPTRLFYSHNVSESGGSSGAILGRVSDVADSWGGSTRVRRGLFRGLAVSFDRSELRFRGSTSTETRGGERIRWLRTLGRFDHILELRRRTQGIGQIGLDLEQFVGRAVQSADLNDLWRWRAELLGFSDINASGGEERSLDTYSATANLTRTGASGGRLNLSYNGSLRGQEGASDARAQLVGVQYDKKVGTHWRVGPRVGYGWRDREAASDRTTTLGLSASWNHDTERLERSLSARVSRLQTRPSGPEGGPDTGSFGFSLLGFLSHTGAGGLRKELELDASRNEFDTLVQIGPGEGDEEVGVGLSVRDRLRLRLTARRRLGNASLTVRMTGQLTESVEGQAGEAFDGQSLALSARLGRGKVNLWGRVLQSDSTSDVQGERTRRSISSGLDWRALRSLSVEASYRLDEEDSVLLEALRNDLLQANLQWRFGATFLDLTVFRSTTELEMSPPSENVGASVSLSRSLAGWLPIVTGERRRGVIR